MNQILELIQNIFISHVVDHKYSDQVQPITDQSKSIRILQKNYDQVNEVKREADSNLFYCTDCINEDQEFQVKNYLLIEQIIQKGENNIIQKWPPVNDCSLILNSINHNISFQEQLIILQSLKTKSSEKLNFVNKKNDQSISRFAIWKKLNTQAISIDIANILVQIYDNGEQK
ncbi:hypothetical protein ABPG72_017619 [Tetrahymena utriculariae]